MGVPLAAMPTETASADTEPYGRGDTTYGGGAPVTAGRRSLGQRHLSAREHPWSANRPGSHLIGGLRAPIEIKPGWHLRTVRQGRDRRVTWSELR